MSCLSGCSKTYDHTKIIAHRGASAIAPENTVAAVKQAWAQNADAAEIDIYLTADNKIMVLHDLTTKRTAGPELNIETSTSHQLRKLDVGTHKSPKYAGEKIPFIEEIFNVLPENKQLFIEIKCDQRILPHLKNAINNSGKKHQLAIICFNLETITKAKQLMPEIPAYWLCGTAKNEETDQWIPHDNKLIEIAQKANLNGLDVSYQGVTKQFTRSVKQANLDLYVWTVDDPELAKKLTLWQVAGITTNKPKAIKN